MRIVQGGYNMQQSAEERRLIDRAYPGGPEEWRELALKLEDSCRRALRVSPKPPGEETVRGNWHDVTVNLTKEEIRPHGSTISIASSIRESLEASLRANGKTCNPRVEPITGENRLAVALGEYTPLYLDRDIWKYFNRKLLNNGQELNCVTYGGVFSVKVSSSSSGTVYRITPMLSKAQLGAISLIEFGCGGIERILVEGQEGNKVEDHEYFNKAKAIVRQLPGGILEEIDISLSISEYDNIA